MTLPHDGFPRISSEGIRLLQQGMAGDFSGWRSIPTNHPRELPQSELSNCAIYADPKEMHFICRAWAGPWPQLHGVGMVPTVEFDTLNLNEVCIPQSDTIYLTSSRKPWGFLVGVQLAVDDRGYGSKDTTIFGKPEQAVIEEEDEHEVFEVQACQRTLEGFRWPTATSSAQMTS